MESSCKSQELEPAPVTKKPKLTNIKLLSLTYGEFSYLLPNKKEFKSAARSHPMIKICHKCFDRIDIDYVSDLDNLRLNF